MKTPKLIQLMERNDLVITTKMDYGWHVMNGNFELIIYMENGTVHSVDLGWIGNSGRVPLSFITAPSLQLMEVMAAIVGGNPK